MLVMVNTVCQMSQQKKEKKTLASDLSGGSSHVVVTGTGGCYLNPLREVETTTKNTCCMH